MKLAEPLHAGHKRTEKPLGLRVWLPGERDRDSDALAVAMAQQGPPPTSQQTSSAWSPSGPSPTSSPQENSREPAAAAGRTHRVSEPPCGG